MVDIIVSIDSLLYFSLFLSLSLHIDFSSKASFGLNNLTILKKNLLSFFCCFTIYKFFVVLFSVVAVAQDLVLIVKFLERQI